MLGIISTIQSDPTMTRHFALPLLAILLGTSTGIAQHPVQSSSAPVGRGLPAEGREFWLVFQKNYLDVTTNPETGASMPTEPLTLSLFISSATNTNGYVTVPGLDFKRKFTVKGGSVIEVPIDLAAQLTSSGLIERKGIHVVAEAPVTVSALNHRFQTTDTYLAFPTSALGTNYRAMCYTWVADNLLSQLAVVATEDDTHVRITPSVATRGPSQQEIARAAGHGQTDKKASARIVESREEKPTTIEPRALPKSTDPVEIPADSGSKRRKVISRPAEVRDIPMESGPETTDGTVIEPEDHDYTAGDVAAQPIDIVLARGEVYQLIAAWDPHSSCDLTGSAIISDKPIGVFSGHNCAYVPDRTIKSCNILAEQLPPVEAWGTQFVVGTLAGRSSSVVRILAGHDNTRLFLDGKPLQTLNSGAYYQLPDVNRAIVISADEPVLVAQYSKGYSDIDSIGDPMMMILSPVEQYRTAHRFSTPVTGTWQHYVNISAPTRSIDGIRLDGSPVDRSLFIPVGDGIYSVARMEIQYGLHTVEGSEPIGIYNYGFGYDDSSYDGYGNGGSFSVRKRTDR